jgi:hypothetical protein
MKTVFREKMIEVVSRDTTGNVRKLAAHLLAVTVGEMLETGVDCSASATLPNAAIEFVGTSCANLHSLAVVSEDL